MSITEPDKIDMMGIPIIDDGTVILGMTDHLEWFEDDMDSVKEHLLLIQEKINAYLRFIESGEIDEQFPSAKGRVPIIRLMSKYASPPSTDDFFTEVKRILETAGCKFQRVSDEK